MRQMMIAAAMMFALAGAAHAGIVVRISKASQTMHVYVDGDHAYSWRISTGRAGYNTPRGVFRPTRLARMHYSRKYYNSPMPHSIFFHGGYAIHGSYEVRALGRPASHGCIRLHPSNAAELYGLVQEYGAGSTRIVIG